MSATGGSLPADRLSLPLRTTATSLPPHGCSLRRLSGITSGAAPTNVAVKGGGQRSVREGMAVYAVLFAVLPPCSRLRCLHRVHHAGSAMFTHGPYTRCLCCHQLRLCCSPREASAARGLVHLHGCSLRRLSGIRSSSNVLWEGNSAGSAPPCDQLARTCRMLSHSACCGPRVMLNIASASSATHTHTHAAYSASSTRRC